MKRTLWIAYASAALAFLSGLVAVGLNVTENTEPAWLRNLVLRYQPYLPAALIALAGLLLLAQILQATLARPAYRRQTLLEIVDNLVKELPGRAKKNRITIFRRVRGWQVLFWGTLRLLPRPWHPAKRAKFEAVRRVDPFGTYLFAYLRSTQGRNAACVAAFRVGERERDCEGMAGRAWEEGFFALPDLERLRSSDRSRIADATVEEVLQRNDRLRRYVELTRIQDTTQLRSFQTFARHYMGHALDNGQKRPWGVILLDSDEERCPFDNRSPTGGTFGEVFRTHAESLGHLLR